MSPSTPSPSPSLSINLSPPSSSTSSKTYSPSTPLHGTLTLHIPPSSDPSPLPLPSLLLTLSGTETISYNAIPNILPLFTREHPELLSLSEHEQLIFGPGEYEFPFEFEFPECTDALELGAGKGRGKGGGGSVGFIQNEPPNQEGEKGGKGGGYGYVHPLPPSFTASRQGVTVTFTADVKYELRARGIGSVKRKVFGGRKERVLVEGVEEVKFAGAQGGQDGGKGKEGRGWEGGYVDVKKDVEVEVPVPRGKIGEEDEVSTQEEVDEKKRSCRFSKLFSSSHPSSPKHHQQPTLHIPLTLHMRIPYIFSLSSNAILLSATHTHPNGHTNPSTLSLNLLTSTLSLSLTPTITIPSFQTTIYGSKRGVAYQDAIVFTTATPAQSTDPRIPIINSGEGDGEGGGEGLEVPLSVVRDDGEGQGQGQGQDEFEFTTYNIMRRYTADIKFSVEVEVGRGGEGGRGVVEVEEKGVEVRVPGGKRGDGEEGEAPPPYDEKS
ncbi:hypothetical protein FQN54_008468 [Arachnomyces sp. PD_36]|nr:hypothetical protein FQN54_008468 [Arachnomyces sp. PD_36]